jgi:hypothetical protein
LLRQLSLGIAWNLFSGSPRTEHSLRMAFPTYGDLV